MATPHVDASRGKPARCIPYAEFAAHPGQVFDEVQSEREPVLIERDGHQYRLSAEAKGDIWANYDPDAARRAFDRLVGTLSAEDGELLKVQLHADRYDDLDAEQR